MGGTWRAPSRQVWHTAVCPRCRRVIVRVKLPGLMRLVTERVCNECSGGAPAAARRGERRRPRQQAPAR